MSPNPTLESTTAEQHERFNSLVLPHLDRLLGFARRRTNELSDAEDAVQEACVRAWMAFDDLRDATKARPWLYRILRGVLSDTNDKNERRRALVSISRLEDTHEEMVAGEEDSVFMEVASRINSELLRMALTMIPDDFAVAVELHDIDGFKYQEIADIIGAPIGTVMSRISRGRRLLAATIEANRNAWALGTPRNAVATATAGARVLRMGDRGAS